MSKLILFFFSFAILYTVHCSHFKKFNYCKVPKRPGCTEGADPDHGGHVGCHCSPTKSREEYHWKKTKGLHHFRRKITHLHNNCRNKIASGEEKRVPRASNMMVLNYDYELEHLAKCRGLNSYGKGPPGQKESCSYTSKNDTYGQNVATLKPERSEEAPDSALKDFNDKIYGLLETWYNQIERVSHRALERFPKDEAKDTECFTQMVWADTTHLGCARVWNKDPSREPWKLLLICNYKGAGNVKNRLVYRQGEGCSACPSGTKCETKEYPFLCGKFLPIQEHYIDLDDDDDDEQQRYLQNWFLIIASSFFTIFMF